MEDIDKLMIKLMRGEEYCPECGCDICTTTSFKGRANYRNKRTTQSCSCGWSCIVPTDWEVRVQLDLELPKRPR